ncbi:MAG: penicillin-binding protein activator [Rhodospirillales bacterium]|nr:penicillin-binding protein activator [Rhodospirillales bacterium]
MIVRFCRRRFVAVASWLVAIFVCTACQSPPPPIRTQPAPPPAPEIVTPEPQPEIFVHDLDARGLAPADILSTDADFALLVPEPEPGAAPQLPRSSLDAVRVGLLLPLSGRHTRIGKAMLNSAQLAVFKLADTSFELHPYDTKGTPEGAAAAASAAIQDGASLIIGPLLSSSTTAVAGVAQATSTPVISFSNDRTVAGDGVYVLGLTPDAQVERVINFADSQGYRRVAIVAPDNAYGELVVDAAKDAASMVGSNITHIELHDPQSQDFTELAKRLAQLQEPTGRGSLDAAASGGGSRAKDTAYWSDGQGFDALLIANGGRQLQSIAALLPYYGVDTARVKILGTGVWDEPGTGREPSLVGGWFAVPPPESRRDFVEQYRMTYGEAPPRLSTLAYDATALAAVLARTRGVGGFEPQVLTAPNGFSGTEGIFRFHYDGIAERGLAVLQVQPNGNDVVSYAPVGF